MATPARPLPGRDRELARLRELLARAANGSPAFALVTGDGGIGKTRLIEAFLGDATASGAAILVGGCPPGSDGSIPYAPIAEALRGLARSTSAGELDDLLGPTRADIARILPSIGGANGAPDDPGVSGRARLQEAVLSLLERLGASRPPAVLVIEDVQWLDPSTEELVAFLVRNLREAAVLVVATYRTDELPAGHPLRRRLAEVERTGRIERVDVGPLPDDALAGLVRAAAPSLDTRAVTSLVVRSGGNPFIATALANAAGRGSNRLPETLRDVALARLEPLSAGARRIVAAAGLAGSVSGSALERVGGGEAADAGDALREAVRGGVLVRVDGPEDTYGFTQGLVREAAVEELLASERRVLHRALAEALEAEAAAPDRPPVPAAALARHWLGAGEPDRARPLLVAAGADAAHQYAFIEAAAAYAQALAIGSVDGDGPADLDLRRRAAEAALLAGDEADALRLAELTVHADGPHGVDRTSETGDTSGGDAAIDALTRALDLERLARVHFAAGRDDRALAALDDAERLTAGLQASAGWLRIRATRARALVRARRPDDARAAAEAALAHAGGGGGDGTTVELARLRATLGVAQAMTGDVDHGVEALAAARSMLAGTWSGPTGIRPRPSRIGDVLGGVADLASVLARAGRVDEAQAVAEEGGELARRLGVAGTLGRGLDALSAEWLWQRGRWDDADRLTRDLLEHGARGEAGTRLCLVRARLELARGSFADAELLLEAAGIHALSGAGPALRAELHAVAAELVAWRGRLGEARDDATEGLLLLDREGERAGRAELAWLGLRAEADRADRERRTRTSAEADEAREVAEALAVELRAIEAAGEGLPARERLGYPPLGAAEATRLAGASDPDAWARAALAWDRLGEPYPSAYARWREAEAILAGRGSRSRAQEAARAAAETARRLDAGLLRGELERLAQRARLELATEVAPVVPLDPRTAAIRATGLTARELEVLALVARGRTNRQVADELFITEKTAGHHVSNLLGKLGVASRVEAAGVAHRLGLIGDGEDATAE